VQATCCPTSPLKAVHRQGLLSVPIIATRLGLICTTASSGTSPPAETHSPQKKDTRKYPQQAPQFKQGLVSDMMGRLKEVGVGRVCPAALCNPTAGA
jgi:hypothetical protein